jgi:hypothetical protein
MPSRAAAHKSEKSREDGAAAPPDNCWFINLFVKSNGQPFVFLVALGRSSLLAVLSFRFAALCGILSSPARRFGVNLPEQHCFVVSIERKKRIDKVGLIVILSTFTV